MPWFDGTLHDDGIVPFDLADRGLLLGDGLFDTSLVLNGKMVWRDAHIARLVAASQTLGFSVDDAKIGAAIDAVLAQTKEASLRITVTRGIGPRGLPPPPDPKPTIFATTAPLRRAALFSPLKLHVTAIRRNESSPISRLKTLNYLDGILASREALSAGCDDALFLNTKERVACTSVGNVAALIGDQVVTPPLDDGVLPGIVRDVVLKTCNDLGLEPVERSLALPDIDNSDALMVTNSLRLIAPVMLVGRKQIDSSANSRVHAIMRHVAELVEATTGTDPRTLAET